MQRHQRRRTRRIHRHRRTLQPQHIGHPTRGDAGQLAGQPEAFYRLGGEHAVALRHYPGEYPGGAAAQSGRIDTGPLQRLPGQLQQHPLLGVHREGLARPHPEEGGVEVADPVHKAAGAGVARTRGVGIRVEQPGQIPPAVRREFGEHVAALDQHVPHVVRGIHPAGIAARHAHDRDRILARGAYRGCVLDFLWEAGKFGADIGGQPIGCRVVEDERG
ncbi:Uncharacterised protein [Mycobacterium tuberculosis]|nr:Uncharacterised protein [Mycobacterium tuberculosis]